LSEKNLANGADKRNKKLRVIREAKKSDEEVY